MRRVPVVFAGFAIFINSARADAPLSYLRGFGEKADATTPLLWGLIVVSCVVIVLISAFVIAGAMMRRSRDVLPNYAPIALVSQAGGANWIIFGVGVSTLVLIGLVVWNGVTMAAILGPPPETKLEIEVRAHQWWWEFRYHDPDPSQGFTTANELHIPVGETVKFLLASDDVIHSFWIPALGGKTDVIPGQMNLAWLKADRPGIYRGQCGEYCGKQHAHMALLAKAESADDFSAWRKQQLAAAPPRPNGLADAADHFVLHCGACHTVRGTSAGGRVGPDLTHLMSRSTIAAASLPNNIGYLSGWIANPQGLKPGCHMPGLDISAHDLDRIRAFLETLK